MKLRNVIQNIILEALGDQRFESGAMTYDADQLIHFADNDFEVYEFSIRNPGNPIAVYNLVRNKFEKKFGPLNGDAETTLYDFLANYEQPEKSKEELAKDIFGGYMNGKVKFDQNWGHGFIVNVSPSFIEDAKELANKKGFECKRMAATTNNHDGTFPMLVMPRV